MILNFSPTSIVYRLNGECRLDVSMEDRAFGEWEHCLFYSPPKGLTIDEIEDKLWRLENDAFFDKNTMAGTCFATPVIND